MLKSEKAEKGDWRRARCIAYFSDLKINRTEDIEFNYIVKNLVQLYSDYRASSSFIKKEEEDLLADKEEYVNAFNELKEIADDNISSNEDRELWINIKKILEKRPEEPQQNTEENQNKVPENQLLTTKNFD